MAPDSSSLTSKQREHATGADIFNEDDDHSILTDSHQTGDAGSDSGKHSLTDALGISSSDRQVVAFSRWMFLICLLASATVLGTIIYFVTHGEEVEDFETQFAILGYDVIHFAEENVIKVMTILAGLSQTTTSALLDDVENVDNNGFLTLPHAEDHFETARASSGALVLAYLPLIQADEVLNWKNYSQANQGWIAESNRIASSSDKPNTVQPIRSDIWTLQSALDAIAELSQDKATCEDLSAQRTHLEEETDQRMPVSSLSQSDSFSPVWTFSPPPKANDTFIVNFDLQTNPLFHDAVEHIGKTQKPAFLNVCNNQAAWFHNDDYADLLQTAVVYPVFGDFESGSSQRTVVGHLVAILPWQTFFSNILRDDSEPVQVVMENTCDERFTFQVQGRDATILAQHEDQHNPKYEYLGMSEPFRHDVHEDGDVHAIIYEHDDDLDVGQCLYTITIYPTQEMEDFFLTSEPVWYAMVVLSIFIITSMLFILFDCFVQKRTDKVITTALKQNAIVSSLFPKSVRAKLMAEIDGSNNRKLSKMGKAGLRNYLSANDEGSAGQIKDNGGALGIDKSKPIADLFPETTIMFADISGFTAWSSTREPSHVFTLLETIYHEFDRIARRRKVFKVEVVGDCYVAVCGLPDPRRDHALVMAKFAHEALREMNRLTQQLVIELGPDTTDLKLRVGLHSGPVVAGVLRGEKSRFQLFGDTMNTASRMESTGIPNRIQMSQATTERLIGFGKKHWCLLREDKVTAKGKGELQTFFLKHGNEGGTKSALTSEMSTVSSIDLDEFGIRDHAEALEKTNRIGDWTVEVMACLLREIAARRIASGTKRDPTASIEAVEKPQRKKNDTSTVINEVQEIIMLPAFDAKTAQKETKLDPQAVALNQDIFDELRCYVRTIASLYNNNPFHNFDHANHVTMSVGKLLSRIVVPDIDEVGDKSLHDHTYGITSDPLTRFAVVFSALIHDADHTGVSNTQLVKEKSHIAELYNDKSVAEQNSVDLAWGLLMEPSYENLRQAIYSTKAEFGRFRKLVVNTVMATDIMDKDLKKLRNDRWDAAFALSAEEERKDRRAVNRKATIVIEHLIQASDVAHTMQHWNIYRKWNERLFTEMYRAYEAGRLETDPSENWYKGEMGFFDFYIIPLAKKLKDCGVFGVSSDEYLSYALQNRNEWEERGQEVVAEMIKEAKRKDIANKVFAIQQESVDQDGAEIIHQMSKALRRVSSSTTSLNRFTKEARPAGVSTSNLNNNINTGIAYDSDEDNNSIEYEVALKPI